MAIDALAPTSRNGRRAQARSRLISATIESLTEVGYAGTTVRGVSRRAGVSQGATTHHFPYRRQLIGAALDELADRAISEQVAKIPLLPRESEARRAATLDLLRTGLSGQLFIPWARLWVAARDDGELREIMRPVEVRVSQMLRAFMREALPELVDDPAFDARLGLIFSLLRGLGMQMNFDPRRDERRSIPWSVYAANISMTLDASPEQLGVK